MDFQFVEWSHHYGSSNASSASDGSIQEVHVRGQFFGFIRMSGGRDYRVLVGHYPNEKLVGTYRTERKAQSVMLEQIWKAQEEA